MKLANVLSLALTLSLRAQADDSSPTPISAIVTSLVDSDEYEIQSGRANLENAHFDDNSETFSLRPNAPRELGESNHTCIDRDEFLSISQRYIMLRVYKFYGVNPTQYDPNVLNSNGGERFDECKWAGIECTNGNIHRLLFKDIGLALSSTITGATPPPGIGLLKDLEVLDLSDSVLGVVSGSFLNPELNDLKNLRVIDISYTGVTGEFGCSKHGQSRFITYGGPYGGQFVGEPDKPSVGEFTCTCKRDICYNVDVGNIVEYDPVTFDDVAIDEDFSIGDDDGSIIVGTDGGNRMLTGDCIKFHRYSDFGPSWYKFEQSWALAELFYITGIRPTIVKNAAFPQYGGIDGAFNPEECFWLGVSCNDGGYVTRLDLKGEGLSSGRAVKSPFNDRVFPSLQPSDVLPDSLTWLRFLEFLDLSVNRALVGNLPNDLHHLSHLRFLDVSQTQLAGKIKCNRGGKKKLVTFGGTAVGLGGPGSAFLAEQKDGDLDDKSWGFFKDNKFNQDNLGGSEVQQDIQGDQWIAGGVRFGINCACSKDICLQKKADIRIKPYD